MTLTFPFSFGFHIASGSGKKRLKVFLRIPPDCRANFGYFPKNQDFLFNFWTFQFSFGYHIDSRSGKKRLKVFYMIPETFQKNLNILLRQNLLFNKRLHLSSTAQVAETAQVEQISYKWTSKEQEQAVKAARMLEQPTTILLKKM